MDPHVPASPSRLTALRETSTRSDVFRASVRDGLVRSFHLDLSLLWTAFCPIPLAFARAPGLPSSSFFPFFLLFSLLSSLIHGTAWPPCYTFEDRRGSQFITSLATSFPATFPRADNSRKKCAPLSSPFRPPPSVCCLFATSLCAAYTRGKGWLLRVANRTTQRWDIKGTRTVTVRDVNRDSAVG